MSTRGNHADRDPPLPLNSTIRLSWNPLYEQVPGPAGT